MKPMAVLNAPTMKALVLQEKEKELTHQKREEASDNFFLIQIFNPLFYIAGDFFMDIIFVENGQLITYRYNYFNHFNINALRKLSNM
jgi:hypothetical protein